MLRTKLSGGLLSFLLFAFAGCAVTPHDPNPTVRNLGKESGIEVNGYFNDAGIVEPDPGINYERMSSLPFRVSEISGRTEANGIRRAQAIIMSQKTRDSGDVQYRFLWFDETGVAIDSLNETWSTLTLLSKESRVVGAMAPRPDAKRFKLIVRPL